MSEKKKDAERRVKLTGQKLAAVKAFKGGLKAAKQDCLQATNEQIALSATRYGKLLSPRGPAVVISGQKINQWMTAPQDEDSWTSATARVPVEQHDFEALVLSLVQHGAWGENASGKAACKKMTAEWAKLLGLHALTDESLALVTKNDDPESDVPHMLGSLLDGIFEPTIKNPAKQRMRSLLCVPAVTAPSIDLNEAGLAKLVRYIQQGGCYALISPYNLAFHASLSLHHGAVSQYYGRIHDRCVSLVGAIRDRLANEPDGGFQNVCHRVKLLRPIFDANRAAAYRIFSPVIGAIARPILCCTYNMVSGSLSTRHAAMVEDGRGTRLEIRDDHGPGTYQEIEERSRLREYCGEVIQAWEESDRLSIPEKFESDIWEYEPDRR